MKRKAADGDEYGEGDDGAPFSEANVPGAPCAAPRKKPSRSGGKRKRTKEDPEEALKSEPQVPQPQAQVSAAQAQLQDSQPQPLVAQYQPPQLQAQVPQFQYQTPELQPLVAQHQHPYLQAQDPQAPFQDPQFDQEPEIALEDYMALVNNTGGLAGQNNVDDDDDEAWMEFLDLEYLGI